MQSNKVCGNIITRANAPKYLEFSRACLFAITRCLTSNQRLGLMDLDQTLWTITTSPEGSTPEYEEKEDAMRAIANRHISLIEEWKGYRYGGLHKVALELLSPTHGYFPPVYELRNWFSYDLGVQNSSLDDQQKRFRELLRYYENLLPLVKELVTKLEASLLDEDAWTDRYIVQARLRTQGQAAYTQDGEEVRLEMEKEEQRFALMLVALMLERAEKAMLTRLARLAGEEEEWVQAEVSGAEEGASDVVWEAHIEAECVDNKQALFSSEDEDEDVDNTDGLREWYSTEDEGYYTEDSAMDDDVDCDASASIEDLQATVARFVFDYTG